jgi:hypothetical protein
MSLPVLTYIKKRGCPACKSFEEGKVWQSIVDGSGQDYTCVIFEKVQRDDTFPGPISPYANWAPALVLFNPDSYYRVFTPHNIESGVYPSGYVVKGEIFNAVLTPQGYRPGSIPLTSENVQLWLYGDGKSVQGALNRVK